MRKQTKLILGSITAMMLFGGCGQQTPPPTLQNRMEVFKELPTWVHGSGNPYIATGSAPFRGQDYSMQRDEAVIVAKANLAESLEQKVDSLKKLHKGTKVGEYNDIKVEMTTKQISSKLLMGTIITNTYMASNGELFVQVMLNPKFISTEGEKLFIASDLRVDSAFKELEKEAEKLDIWKKQ